MDNKFLLFQKIMYTVISNSRSHNVKLMNNWHNSYLRRFCSLVYTKTVHANNYLCMLNNNYNHILYAKHIHHCLYWRSKWLLHYGLCYKRRKRTTQQAKTSIMNCNIRHRQHLLRYIRWTNSLKHRHLYQKEFVLKYKFVFRTLLECLWRNHSTHCCIVKEWKIS